MSGIGGEALLDVRKLSGGAPDVQEVFRSG